MNNIIFDKFLYKLDAIKRTLVDYSEDLSFEISQDEKNYIIKIEPKSNNSISSDLIKELKNKIIEEEVRISIENETKAVRESLYLKAMDIKKDTNEAS